MMQNVSGDKSRFNDHIIQALHRIMNWVIEKRF